MAGAYAAATGLLSRPALAAAAAEALPPYRTQHRALNDAAIAAGFAAVEHGVVPAWPQDAR
jgi:hypothetical protein